MGSFISNLQAKLDFCPTKTTDNLSVSLSQGIIQLNQFKEKKKAFQINPLDANCLAKYDTELDDILNVLFVVKRKMAINFYPWEAII